jgi:lactate dehydrogenase-like 2-hydroxyacid dehydrogenase
MDRRVDPHGRHRAAHQAGGTIEARKAMGKLARDNLAANFADRPLCRRR